MPCVSISLGEDGTVKAATGIKARTHDATLPATSRATWKLHRVSTLEIVARNVACNCCRSRIGFYFCKIARNCFTVCPSSATLRATSWRKSCAQCCIVCPRLKCLKNGNDRLRKGKLQRCGGGLQAQGGGTAIYMLNRYRYVPQNRVWFFRFSVLR